MILTRIYYVMLCYFLGVYKGGWWGCALRCSGRAASRQLGQSGGIGVSTFYDCGARLGGMEVRGV